MNYVSCNMRWAIFAIYLLAHSLCFGQSGARMIKFVDDNMGKRVGRGVCYELIKEATGDKGWFGNQWAHKKKYRVRTPKEGDAIEFCKVTYRDKHGLTLHIDSHLGIVYKIMKDGDIIVAEQNVGVKSLKDSKVILSPFNYKQIECGKIKFYRFD